jgi:hypothetical protein
MSCRPDPLGLANWITDLDAYLSSFTAAAAVGSDSKRCSANRPRANGNYGVSRRLAAENESEVKHEHCGRPLLVSLPVARNPNNVTSDSGWRSNPFACQGTSRDGT